MSNLKTKNNLDSKISRAIQNVVEGVKDNPENAKATFSVKSRLEEGFQSTIDIRDFQLISDEPEELGGTNQGANPVEYVLGALAACQEIVIKAHALALDIDIKSVEVNATGDLDLHGFFNLSNARPGYKNVSFTTEIETDESDTDKLEKLKQVTQDSCPVLDIIKNPVPVEGEVKYVS